MAKATGFRSSRPSACFDLGDIVIGEACRSDFDPNLGGKAPLLRYDGKTGLPARSLSYARKWRKIHGR
jgi:hypothetical protein